MIRNILIAILFFSAISTEAQNKMCEPTLLYEINTKSGMKMRAGPGTNFDVVIYVPAKSKLLVCEELFTPATIEDIKGHWRRVKHKEKYGYMFDGFLDPVENTSIPAGSFKLAQLLVIDKILNQDITKLDSVLAYLTEVARINGYEDLVGPPLADRDSLFTYNVKKKKKKPEVKSKPAFEFKILTEAYNYCGDIKDIDPGKLWYAVYRKNNQFLLKRIELMIVRSKYSLGSGLEFDIKTEDEVASYFLVSSNQPLDTNWSVTQSTDYFIDNPNKLYPGQKVQLYATEPVEDLHNIRLYATGNVMDVGKCPEMEDYRIKVNAEMHNDLKTQDLTPEFNDLGDCGIPEIFWFGDLNSDLYPDIIFVSRSLSGLTFTLFVSDTQDTNILYRKADQWFNHNCE